MVVTNGKWVSIYPNGIRSEEGSYIRIWPDCECTEPIIVMDDGNDDICPCGIQYFYVAAHVDVWKDDPSPPPPTDGINLSATGTVTMHDTTGLGGHAAKGGR